MKIEKYGFNWYRITETIHGYTITKMYMYYTKAEGKSLFIKEYHK